jgi:uncharacterized Zn finger protein
MPTAASTDPWANLTWNDLENWAGVRSVERGRTYQRQGLVKNLAKAKDGRLLAHVQGTKRYIVAVWPPDARSSREPRSQCTCPVGLQCKHAVATVAAYLQALANRASVPEADAKDPRWKKLERVYSEDQDDLDDYGDENLDDDEEYDEDDVYTAARDRTPRPAARAMKSLPTALAKFLAARPAAELAALLLSLAERYPEVRDELTAAKLKTSGNVKELVARTRKEIQTVTANPGWANHWNGEGDIPDYRPLKEMLEALVALGAHDQLVDLGRLLLDRGLDQVNASHDEGETAQELATCLPVVFKALQRSSLTSADRVLFTIDACLADEIDVLDEVVGPVLDENYPPDVWLTVAETLSKRLTEKPSGRRIGYGDDYLRRRIVDWIASAYRDAGRDDLAAELREKEITSSGDYVALVRLYLERGQDERAEHWAKEGIKKTAQSLPGVASELAGQLVGRAQERGDWVTATAFSAYKFFSRPSSVTLNALTEAARQAGCACEVHAAALAFLEHGTMPFIIKRIKGALAVKPTPGWPLPVPEFLLPLIEHEPYGPWREKAPRPRLDVLLEIALNAGHSAEILGWYDRLCKAPRTTQDAHEFGARTARDFTARVAAAVAATQPQRALALYDECLREHLQVADPHAYANVANTLKLMRPIYNALAQDDAWALLIQEIRDKYKARRKLLEVLDKLEELPIVKSLASKKSW